MWGGRRRRYVKFQGYYGFSLIHWDSYAYYVVAITNTIITL